MKKVVQFSLLLSGIGLFVGLGALPASADTITSDAAEPLACCKWGEYMGRKICVEECNPNVGERPGNDTPHRPPRDVNDGDRNKGKARQQ